MNQNYIETGLSEKEVIELQSQGLTNGDFQVKTKSYTQIFIDNAFTFFNALNLVLFCLILFTGSLKNGLFMGVVLSNILIGSIQEIRAKKTIDRLSLISSPKVKVVRSGNTSEILPDQIVLHDLCLYQSGMQICSDSIILEGECEVDESLLTGESDTVYKSHGDEIHSGSFVISGSCKAKVIRVGADNFTSKIIQESKKVEVVKSEIITSVNELIKYIAIAIIPIGIIFFLSNFLFHNYPWDESMISTVALLIGMIPEGLVLLTSVVFAVGVVRLSRHGALINDLYSIESLARVDTLCLDKTGTITEGRMEYLYNIPFGPYTEEDIDNILSEILYDINDSNATAEAIKRKLEPKHFSTMLAVVPFSSSRKWSACTLDSGTYVFGALEYIHPLSTPEQFAIMERESSGGNRVLSLCFSKKPMDKDNLPDDLEVISFIILTDIIRGTAKSTIEYFQEQNVEIKIISGDHPFTVSKIAERAGVKNASRHIDLSTLTSDEEVINAADKYTVFGRVNPQQKKILVHTLKNQGHTVAMTGDGVNDVLALKESDIGIAMASGSDAARTVSKVVLMNSDFSTLPEILLEGRKSINNLQRSASLFLVKTIFSVISAILFLCISFQYPFEPIQFSLFNAITIGIPSFILALEPNHDLVRGKFLPNILKNAIPGGLTMVFGMIVYIISTNNSMGFEKSEISTMAILLITFIGLINLIKVCLPMNFKRLAMILILTALFIFTSFCFKQLFSFSAISPQMLIHLIPSFVGSFLFYIFINFVSKMFFKKKANF